MGMTGALAFGTGLGVLTGVSSFIGAENQRHQMKAQAGALKSQAKIAQMQGEVEASNLERQKTKLRQQYEELQGHNASLLAAGNVDMTSGSAWDVSMGNAIRFADDMGETSYQKAVKQWETAQNVKTLEAQSSYLKRSAGNLGTSLLTATLSGLTAGLGGFSQAGGLLSKPASGID